MIQHHRGMPPFERVGGAADYEAQQDPSRNKHQYREPHRQAHGLSNYGTSVGGRHYSLEVIQNPIRARMCGFGDKDRRPLAPAAVARMVVRDENLQPVDVDDIDFAFFIAAVDLWSADGEREVNLVLHPSSADRYIPATQVTKRRRQTNSTPPAQSIPSTSAFSAQPQGPEPAPTTTSFAAFSSQSFSFGHDQTSPFPFGQSATLFTTSELPPTDHSSPSFLSADPAWHDSAGRPVHMPVRGWTADPSHDLSLGGPSDVAPATQHNDGFDPRLADTGALFGSLAPPSQPQPPLAPPGQETLSMQISGLSPRAAGQGQTSFTRTLVGPLVSNAQKLQDEHRKAGIFFLFQDLSVRTEGQFRLRIRLMNVGMPPAPNRGATRIHQSSSNVLAQAFTEPFTVFSAKRFPGVPDTTALSIAFGNQGQKLPLRNRNGKRGRKDDDSGDDDD